MGLSKLKCCICGYSSEKSILSHVRNEHGLTAQEYRSKYNSPLRVSWVKDKSYFKELGSKNSALMKGKKGRATLPKGVWSRQYDKCIKCSCSDSPHISNGICKRCYNKSQQREVTENRNAELFKSGEEGVDYVVCRICQKPFAMLSTHGHLRLHGITDLEYKDRFPGASLIPSKVNEKRALGVSAGRKKLMEERGYLNPYSQREKKSKEMSERHSKKDFAKVSKVEDVVSDWFKEQGAEVFWSEDMGKSTQPNNSICRQYLLDGRFCVDFADINNKVVIEVLGDWWHGWDFLNGRADYSCLHPEVKKNLKLDKLRFEYIEASEWSVIKVWEHDVKDGNLGSVLSSYCKQTVVSRDISVSDVVNTTTERWNARYFNTHNVLSIENMKLMTKGEASILRKELDRYGDNLAIPEETISHYFDEARKDGFPYIELDKAKFRKGILTTARTDIKKMGDVYNWSGNGSELASYFHPHMFECNRKGKMSAIEFFNSDDDFTRGVWKSIALHKSISKAKIREICRSESKSSRINQFPPRVAMAVIEELFGGEEISIIDPTHGFSGRMIGAFCSKHVKKYTGVDLSKKTHKGAVKTKEWLSGIDSGMEIELHCDDCIGWMRGCNEKFDLLLTSPPFLNVEQYVGVEFKSDYKEWLNEFIIPFILGAKRVLRNGGKMAVYLEKIGERDFIGDFSEIAVSHGFKRCDSVLFKMSYGENNRSNKSVRGVQILVFENA